MKLPRLHLPDFHGKLAAPAAGFLLCKNRRHRRLALTTSKLVGGRRTLVSWLSLALFTILAYALPAYMPTASASAGVNQSINIQGKVTNSDGTNVTDGTYDFVYKLYDGAGSAAANTFTESWTAASLFSSTMSSAPASGGESLTYSSDTNESSLQPDQILWNTTKVEAVKIVSVNTTGTGGTITISPTRQAWSTSDTITNKIYVKDGIFQVALNSLNNNWGTTDFNQDTIYLGVNFNSDGEMKPRSQFNAVPFALNAQMVNGLTVTNNGGNTLNIAAGKSLIVNNSLTFAGTDATSFTLPTASDTLAGLSATQALINKTINGLTITSTTGTLTVASGKTLTASNTLTLTGTDSASIAFGGGGTVCYTGTCAANAVRLDQVTAATSNNTIDNTTFSQVWNWGTLTTQTGMTLGGGSGMTIGSVAAINNATYVHTAAETGNVLTLAFADASTNTSGASVTNGITITPTINTSGAGTKTINGIIVSAPTVTACTSGACTYNGLSVTGGSAGNVTSTALAIDAGSGGGTNYAATFNRGNVGIGTNSPSSLLTVNGQTDVALPGTVSVTNASRTVTTTSNLLGIIDKGDAVMIGGVAYIASDVQTTTLTLETAYTGSTASGLTAYRDPNLLDIANGAARDVFTIDHAGTATLTHGGLGDMMVFRGNLEGWLGNGAYVDLALDNLGGTSDYKSQISFRGNGTEKFALGVDPNGNGSNQFYINDTTATATRLFIDTTGYVGLGFTSPSFPLHVAGGSNGAVTDIAQFGNGGSGSGTENRIILGGDSTHRWAAVSGKDDGVANQGSLHFYTLNGGTLTDQSYFDTGGTLYLDAHGLSTGFNHALAFGGGSSGEGIASKRTAGGNQNGLDLYTSFNSRLSISNGGVVTLGTSTNGLTLDPASGPTYTGAARPVKTIALSAEYAGATLTADGSATTNGSMTSDNVLNAGSAGWMNYYQWTSTQAALQDYTVMVKVTLPQDFDSWQTGSCPGSTCAMEVNYQTGVTGTTNNTVSVQVNNATTTPGTVICTLAAASSTTWTTMGCTSTNLATSPAWNTAGSTAVLRIKLAANSTASALARVGDINLRYYAKY